MINYLNTYRRYACDIHRINREASVNAEDLVNTAEAIFRNDIAIIADRVLSTPYDRHIVLLAGPSGSGKTTGAKKLADEIMRKGCQVEVVSMDDFYLGKDYVKLLPNGKPDFESVEALDIPLIRNSISRLIDTGECDIPKYDFTNSQRSSIIRHLSFSKDSVLIIEGIHALNPIFSSDNGAVNRIYISVKQGIKDNEDYVITNRQIRCIRRIVRDHSFRKVEPEHMLDMWSEVVDGEKKYIRPYRYTSDFTINSIHIYEPCIMIERAIPLLNKIDKSSVNYEEAHLLISSLEKFEPIDSSLIPKDSLIREFIGGGSYLY